MKKKVVLFLMLMVSVSFVWAETLTISAVSFSDTLGHPVEKDYRVDSYKIVGKNMPSASTITGQFSKEFSEIPIKVENLPKGDNWKVKVYAYDNGGNLIGESEEETIAISRDVEMEANIIVDVPALKLSEPVLAGRGKYYPLSDYYEVSEYKLTFTSLQDGKELIEVATAFPYTTSTLYAGDWNLNIEAIDKDGNVIASNGNLRFKLGERGSLPATIALDIHSKRMSFTTNGTMYDNGYIYLQDSSDFEVKASLYPLSKSDAIKYRWYISNDGEWILLEGKEGSSISYGDIEEYVDNGESFSLLCRPVLNGRTYYGEYITISSIPELTPMLYMSGISSISLEEEDNKVEITTASDTISFALDLPTYYLGQGVKAYYTIDGSKPTTDSSALVIGDSLKLTSTDSELKLLLVDREGNESFYNIEVAVEKEASAPSISISNRDYGRDLYAVLSTSTEGANIYYTLDGTEPTSSSYLYTEPFKVGTIGSSERSTVKAIAIKEGYKDSRVTSLTTF